MRVRPTLHGIPVYISFSRFAARWGPIGFLPFRGDQRHPQAEVEDASHRSFSKTSSWGRLPRFHAVLEPSILGFIDHRPAAVGHSPTDHVFGRDT